MTDKWYIYQAAQKDAAEKKAFANFMRGRLTASGYTTVYNVITNSYDTLSGLTDNDLTSDKYPIMNRNPSEIGRLETRHYFTTKVLSFYEMTDGRYAVYTPAVKNVIVPDPDQDVLHKEIPMDTGFIFVDTGYDEVVTTRPAFKSIVQEGM